MLSKLKHGHYDSLEDIDNEISEAVKELVKVKTYMRDLYMQRKECAHSYKKSTFTIQRRMIGYVRVNERVCASCSHIETQAERDDGDGKDRPDWAKEATKNYYNNDI